MPRGKEGDRYILQIFKNSGLIMKANGTRQVMAD
jgi:hypothetical protein